MRTLRELARQLELEGTKHLVALHLDRRRNPTYRLPGTRIDEKQIVLKRDDRTFYLEDESEIFRPGQVEELSFLYLYTPPLDEDSNERAKELLWQTVTHL